MARSKQTFKQSDVTRAIKGARAAGMEPRRVDVVVEGPRAAIVLRANDDEDTDQENDWDDWLKINGDG